MCQDFHFSIMWINPNGFGRNKMLRTSTYVENM